MKILDAHTHFFSRAFFEALASASPLDGSLDSKLEFVATQSGVEIPTSDHTNHTQRWISLMDDAGVDQMVSFASAPAEADTVSKAQKFSEGRLVGFTVVDPTAENAVEWTAKAVDDLAMKGLVVFPSLQRFDPGGSEFAAILEVANSKKIPVVVHCGVLKIKLRDLFQLPKQHAPHLACPLRLVSAAHAFPETPLIIPHFGAGLFREALMAADMAENIYLDTSSSNDWRRLVDGTPDLQAIFQRTLGVIGPERLLFGTDSSTLPRGYRGDLLQQTIQILEELKVSDEDRALILGGNMKRLLNL